MTLEQGRISSSQFFFLLVAFMQSMALTISFSFSFTQQCTWVAVITAYGITLLVVLLLLSIARRYPGKNLIQINDAVFGPYLGKLLSAIYLWFFFNLTIHCMYFFNGFWITYIMPETPRSAFLVMFGIVCAMAVRKGLEVITRCCFLFSVVVWITTFILVVLLLGDMNPAFLLPLTEASVPDFVQSLHIMISILFCDIVAFLMIFPYVTDQKKIKKMMFLGVSVCSLQLLIVTLRDIMVLGPSVGNVASASFMVARQINIANILTRMDILVAISLLITVFAKVTVFYYVTVLGTAQLLKMSSYKPLVIPVGLLVITIGATLYPNDMEQVYAARYAWPFYASISEFVLPILTIIVIGIRRLAGRKEEMEAQ